MGVGDALRLAGGAAGVADDEPVVGIDRDLGVGVALCGEPGLVALVADDDVFEPWEGHRESPRSRARSARRPPPRGNRCGRACGGAPRRVARVERHTDEPGGRGAAKRSCASMLLSSRTPIRSPGSRPSPSRALARRSPRVHASPNVSRRSPWITAVRSALSFAACAINPRTSMSAVCWDCCCEIEPTDLLAWSCERSPTPGGPPTDVDRPLRRRVALLGVRPPVRPANRALRTVPRANGRSAIRPEWCRLVRSHDSSPRRRSHAAVRPRLRRPRRRAAGARPHRVRR